MKWDEAVKLAKDHTSRAALCEKIRNFDKVIAEREKSWGPLLQGSSALFKDGRLGMLFQYENMYELVFQNPENPAGTKDKELVLSREMMSAIFGLYQLIGDVERDNAAYKEHASPKTEVE
jgi:hypothetical protein